LAIAVEYRVSVGIEGGKHLKKSGKHEARYEGVEEGGVAM
jgi:hypothetical protein